MAGVTVGVEPTMTVAMAVAVIAVRVRVRGALGVWVGGHRVLFYACRVVKGIIGCIRNEWMVNGDGEGFARSSNLEQWRSRSWLKATRSASRH
jgi:hypothetical protein